MFKITPELLSIWVNGYPEDYRDGVDEDPIPEEGYDPLAEITTEATVRIYRRLDVKRQTEGKTVFQGIEEFDLEDAIQDWRDENGGRDPTDVDLVGDLIDRAYVGEYLGCEFERDEFGSKSGPSRFQQMLLEESLAILKERQS